MFFENQKIGKFIVNYFLTSGINNLSYLTDELIPKVIFNRRWS